MFNRLRGKKNPKKGKQGNEGPPSLPMPDLSNSTIPSLSELAIASVIDNFDSFISINSLPRMDLAPRWTISMLYPFNLDRLPLCGSANLEEVVLNGVRQRRLKNVPLLTHYVQILSRWPQAHRLWGQNDKATPTANKAMEVIGQDVFEQVERGKNRKQLALHCELIGDRGAALIAVRPPPGFLS
jgi:hypothetical protein